MSMLNKDEIVTIPERQVRNLGHWDVVVVGAGPAGCAAARTAAREGAKTLLVEKHGFVGGTPVAKLITPVLSTNGVDFQGVWHDWARALQRLDGITAISREQRHTTNWYVGNVDPEMVKHAWDELLSGDGVMLLHHCHVVDVIETRSRIEAMIAMTPAGIRSLSAEVFVDATGDGVVADAAGCEWVSGADGLPYAMGVSLGARVGAIPNDPEMVPGTIYHAYNLGRPMPHRREAMISASRILETDPLDPWAVTQAERKGRAELLERVAQLRRVSGNDQLYLVESASELGIRSSRRVKGISVVTAVDALDLTKRPDGVARSSWEIDIHSAKSLQASAIAYEDRRYRERIEKTKAGDYFHVPYGCLIPEQVDGLLVAGRCVSAEHEAQASLRIQQTCMALGEAAGLAAAWSVARRTQPRQLDGEEISRELILRRKSVEPAFDEFKTIPVVS
jgi:hypothetical protein